MGMLSGNESDKKPLFRVWSKKNPGKATPIESIRLSSSEEWIIIESEDCVALLNAESKVGQQFWKNCQQFNGKALGLQLIPAKGKLGFDVEPSKVKGDWVWEDDNTLEFGTRRTTKQTTGLALDLWKAMQIKPNASEIAIADQVVRAGIESVKDTELEGAIVETVTDEKGNVRKR